MQKYISTFLENKLYLFEKKQFPSFERQAISNLEYNHCKNIHHYRNKLGPYSIYFQKTPSQVCLTSSHLKAEGQTPNMCQ